VCRQQQRLSTAFERERSPPPFPLQSPIRNVGDVKYTMLPHRRQRSQYQVWDETKYHILPCFSGQVQIICHIANLYWTSYPGIDLLYKLLSIRKVSVLKIADKKKYLMNKFKIRESHAAVVELASFYYIAILRTASQIVTPPCHRLSVK